MPPEDLSVPKKSIAIPATAVLSILTAFGGGFHEYNQLVKQVEENSRALRSDGRWNCADMEKYLLKLERLNPELKMPPFPKNCPS